MGGGESALKGLSASSSNCYCLTTVGRRLQGLEMFHCDRSRRVGQVAVDIFRQFCCVSFFLFCRRAYDFGVSSFIPGSTSSVRSWKLLFLV